MSVREIALEDKKFFFSFFSLSWQILIFGIRLERKSIK